MRYRQVKHIFHFILLACAMLPVAADAQVGGFADEPDTIAQSEIPDIDVPRSRMFSGRPGKAALFSLIIPGAGQIYNKRYWKAPLVWGAVGGVGAWMLYNIDEYKYLRDVYRDRLIADMEGIDPTDDLLHLTTNQVKGFRDQYDRYRQMSIFIFAMTWIANSAEAFVDAHLKDFDVSDDISIRFNAVDPKGSIAAVQMGVTITF